MEDVSIIKEEHRRTRRGRAKVLGGLLGAFAGAGTGGIAAGPPGAVVGALTGAAMGAATAWAAHRGTTAAADRDSQLDIEIGVHGPDLGAPNLEHRPAVIGAYSSAASGAGGAAEGGIQAV